MAFYFKLLTMVVLRITFIIILTFSLFSEIGWCGLQEHPVVQNIKKVLDGKVVSERCAKVLRIFIERLYDAEDEDIWAIKMLDATSKVPVGPLSYRFGDLGHFQECTNIESKRENVTGKYCLGQIGINASAEFYSKQDYNKDMREVVSIISHDIELVPEISWAMCLPSSCTMEDVILLINKQQPVGFDVTEVSCQTIEDVYPLLSRDALIGISILSLLALIVLISTSYDIYCQNHETAHPSLVAFSLYTNSKKLFHHSKRVSSLSCLDGIRVISMLWIIILHTWSISVAGTIFDTKNSVNISNSIIGMVIINGDFACDTFLLVCGTLVTYTYFKRNNDKTLTFSFILQHYIHRIIRLTPVLAGVVLISGTLLRYMGSGPKWPVVISVLEEPCKKNWWLNLLYIQNQFEDNLKCVRQAWYLDVDMQLYIFSPLIFWILSKYSKAGITLLILATFSSIVIGFIRASRDKMSFDYTNDYYFKTETRAAPWIIGTILGYCLTRKGFNQICLPKKIAVPIWILSFAIILISIFSSFGTLKIPGKIENPFHITFVRPSFAVAVGWIIWACATNHGGIINNILSLSIFQFLNKFIYSIYLFHPTMLFLIVYSSRTSAYLSFLNLAYWFWGISMFAFGISIISILVLEMPIIAIEKSILSPSTKKEEVTANTS